MTPNSWSTLPAGLLAPSCKNASRMCSAETYSSLSLRACSCASVSSLFRRLVIYTLPRSTPGPLTRGFRSSSCSSRSSILSTGMSIFRNSLGASPSCCSSIAIRRCSLSTSIWPKRIALVSAACMASWDLVVNLLISMETEPFRLLRNAFQFAYPGFQGLDPGHKLQEHPDACVVYSENRCEALESALYAGLLPNRRAALHHRCSR